MRLGGRLSGRIYLRGRCCRATKLRDLGREQRELLAKLLGVMSLIVDNLLRRNRLTPNLEPEPERQLRLDVARAHKLFQLLSDDFAPSVDNDQEAQHEHRPQEIRDRIYRVGQILSRPCHGQAVAGPTAAGAATLRRRYSRTFSEALLPPTPRRGTAHMRATNDRPCF